MLRAACPALTMGLNLGAPGFPSSRAHQPYNERAFIPSPAVCPAASPSLARNLESSGCGRKAGRGRPTHSGKGRVFRCVETRGGAPSLGKGAGISKSKETGRSNVDNDCHRAVTLTLRDPRHRAHRARPEEAGVASGPASSSQSSASAPASEPLQVSSPEQPRHSPGHFFLLQTWNFPRKKGKTVSSPGP